MTWQIVLVLVGAGIMLVVVAVLGIVLAIFRKRLREALGECEKWRGECQEARDVAARMKLLSRFKKSTDREARNELLKALDDWDPTDPSGLAGKSGSP